ncbi:hypothetical protein ElP_04910 [Tautonia plasticadhaerens]|uniref:Uncharacterized protein n=1 Tax=Tautonia plasticadhaerens TaxID=2527974 RepID=A0A518GVN2_9BACT|nr:hypothetical protein ElP_04910 [Tautonia plasticadhaerens]
MSLDLPTTPRAVALRSGHPPRSALPAPRGPRSTPSRPDPGQEVDTRPRPRDAAGTTRAPRCAKTERTHFGFPNARNCKRLWPMRGASHRRTDPGSPASGPMRGEASGGRNCPAWLVSPGRSVFGPRVRRISGAPRGANPFQFEETLSRDWVAENPLGVRLAHRPAPGPRQVRAPAPRLPDRHPVDHPRPDRSGPARGVRADRTHFGSRNVCSILKLRRIPGRTASAPAPSRPASGARRRRPTPDLVRSGGPSARSLPGLGSGGRMGLAVEAARPPDPDRRVPC